VISAKSERVTTCVKNAIADDHIMIVKSRNGIVSHVEITLFNQYVVTGSDIHTVVAAENSDVSDCDILTLEDGVAPVGAVGEGAALDGNILCGPAQDGSVIAIVVEGRLYLMAATRIGQPSVLLCLVRQSSSVPEARIVGFAVFYQNVISAKSERVTTCVKNAIADDHIMIVKSCNSIVTHVEIALFDQYIVAGSDIHAVMAAENLDVSDGDILTLKDGMTPIGAVGECITLQSDALASPKAHSVRSSKSLFALRIIAVVTVNIRALFSDNGDIVRIEGANQSVTPAAGWHGGGAVGRDDLFRRDGFYRVAKKMKIVLIISASLQDGAAFQIQLNARTDAQIPREIYAAGDHDSTAAREKAFVDRLLNRFCLKGIRGDGAEITYVEGLHGLSLSSFGVSNVENLCCFFHYSFFIQLFLSFFSKIILEIYCVFVFLPCIFRQNAVY
jgi:hypothetical protein